MQISDAMNLTFWYEFASPYSYLSAQRVEACARKFKVRVTWQPFLLGPIFKNQGWTTSPFEIYSAKGRYIWHDIARICRNRGVNKISCPEGFPQNSLLAARVAIQCKDQQWLPDFSLDVFRAQFYLGQRIDDPNCINEILFRYARDPKTLIKRALKSPTCKEQLKSATAKASSLGIFGAPTFVTSTGELYWGDDRMDEAIVSVGS